jgi:hypothetical protein
MKIALLLITLMFSIFNTVAFAKTPDTNIYSPPQYSAFMPPPAGGSYIDPVFGTAIKRITDAMKTTDVARGVAATTIQNEYSSMSPFNKDNTRMLLVYLSHFVLYDGSGNHIKDLNTFGVGASSEPRWSRTDPNELYFIVGNQFKKLNVGTNAVTLVKTFSEYTTISGKGESDIGFGGNQFVLSGNNRYIFVFDASTGTKSPVFDAGGRYFDSLYLTPNNNVVVGWGANGSARFNGVELFDKNMKFQRQLTHAIGHMDVTRDTNGDEVLLWANGADPDLKVPCDAGVTKVRLSDAKQTCVWVGDWNLAIHVSATDKSGWFFIDAYNPVDVIPPTGWTKYTNELLQVKMDGSEVRRLAHHRSRPLNGYTYQPKAAANREGTKLVYASNFGLQAVLGNPTEYSDAYLIDVPEIPEEQVVVADAAPAPAAAASGPATRVEQDASSVAYTGYWSSHASAVHSGGSAKLTMEAGSRVTFTFNGTGASWIAYRDEWSGIAKVYVDGAFIKEVDTYVTPHAAQASMYSVSGLAPGSHTLTIEVTGRKNPSSGGAWIWVDAFTSTAAAAVVVSRFEQDASAVTYSGNWGSHASAAHSGGSAKLAMDAGSRVTFVFNGTEASWIAYRDEWSGIAKVYVDGTYRKEVDAYSTPYKAQSSIDSVSGLAFGRHTLTIEVTGRRNPSSGGAWIWVDAFTSTAPAAAIVVTRVEHATSAVTYGGYWGSHASSAHSGGSAKLTMEAGSRATFTFNGSGANWIGYQDEWSGIARIYVDGKFVKEVDTYATPHRAQASVHSVSGLTPGSHTFTIEATGRKGASSGGAWIWVDAFEFVP